MSSIRGKTFWTGGLSIRLNLYCTVKCWVSIARSLTFQHRYRAAIATTNSKHFNLQIPLHYCWPLRDEKRITFFYLLVLVYYQPINITFRLFAILSFCNSKDKYICQNYTAISHSVEIKMIPTILTSSFPGDKGKSQQYQEKY